MLRVEDLMVRFGNRTVLDHLNLEVGEGAVVAVLGASGSGKSTMLRVIAGLLTPDAGQVSINGRDVTRWPTHRRGVAMVFQDEQLFPHLDVAANIAFGLRQQGQSRSDMAARVQDMLTLVGLDGFERRRVTELSGGEAKRVALVRALAPRPRVLLLDEPLTGLDTELHDRLVVELAAVLRDQHITSVLVTHDRAEAAAVADRVVHLHDLQRQM